MRGLLLLGRPLLGLPLLGLPILTAACGGPTVDLRQGLQVEVVSGGWYDAGIVNGQNKLVPAVNVRLRNTSDQKLPVLQLNVLFRQVNAKEEWGSSFQTVSGSQGLAPGATTDTLQAKSQNGYTGSGESRQEMLENSHFVDAKADIFAKYGSTQWVKVSEYTLPRLLITR
jgi:hypothetical protein